MDTQDNVQVQCATTYAMLNTLLHPKVSLKHMKCMAVPSLKFFVVLCLCVGSLAAVSATAMTFAPFGQTPKERSQERLFKRKQHAAVKPSGSNSSKSSAVASGSLVRAQVRKTHGKGFIAQNAKLGTGRLLKLHAAAQTRAAFKTGMYLSGGSTGREEFLAQTMDAIKEAGGDALFIEVKGGSVYFQTEAPMAQKIGSVHPAFDLPAVVAAAHAKDLYVIARFVAVKDQPLAEADPQTRIRNPKTGISVGEVWTDPGAPNTLQYNKEILTDLLKSGIDEVNLDYIRYPTEYSLASIGLTTQEKEEHLEAFLRMTRKLIDSISPKTKLGISTYAILGWDFDINNAALGQNFIRFAPLLDVISPMAYPDSFTSPEYYVPERNPGSRAYSLVYRTLKGYNDLLGPEESKKIRPWLQAYYFTSDQIHDEIKAVYDSGHCGFTFWNANNNYAPAYAGMAAAAGDRPEQCK